ncbi:hypothetical protein BGZ72_007494 [Mortierella alpina]|nr:hypothetical protein BGZ72_007494 [Mortierella alpina]
MEGPRRHSGHSELNSVTLINTNVNDKELVELLKMSPDLEELRLDQCYRLTAASLVAIGQGPSGVQHPQETPQAGTHPPGELPLHVDTAQHSTLIPQAGAGASESAATPSKITPSTFCPKLKVLSLRNCYDLADEGVRALAGCRQLEFLIIRGLRHVDEGTVDWLHSQGVPLRRALSPLGHWRHWLPCD